MVQGYVECGFVCNQAREVTEACATARTPAFGALEQVRPAGADEHEGASIRSPCRRSSISFGGREIGTVRQGDLKAPSHAFEPASLPLSGTREARTNLSRRSVQPGNEPRLEGEQPPPQSVADNNSLPVKGCDTMSTVLKSVPDTNL